MTYSVENFYQDLRFLIQLERNSEYSEKRVRELIDKAIEIRINCTSAQINSQIPFELWRVLSNIDFGAIKREYREWILDDADKVLREIESRPGSSFSGE